MLLGDLATRNAKRYPNKAAIVFEEVRLTFGELNARVNCISNALLSIGLATGDRVAFLLQNSNVFLEFFFGVAKAGMIAVPLNYRLSDRELLEVIEDSDAKLLVVGLGYEETAEKISQQSKNLENYIFISESGIGHYHFNEIIRSYSSSEPVRIPSLDENSLAAIIYTGGTTGKSKGAMFTHRNFLESCANEIMGVGFRADECGLLAIPLFHISIVHILCNFYLGGTTILADRVDPKLMMETIEREKVTYTILVPTAILRLLESPDFGKYDLSTLRTIIYGGAPIPLELLKRTKKTLGDILVQVYGMTEACGTVTCLAKEDHVLEESETHNERIGSLGRALSNTEVKIVDDFGEEVPTGTVGEIVVRGPMVMQGYWKKPEITEQAMRDGWLATGDLAMMDEDGFLYLNDRKKDMIISGGENIYSKEVENVLVSHPSILEAAVVGIPDLEWGEAVKAFVILKQGCQLNADEIIEFCKRNLANYKKPKAVEFVNSLPYTSIGKVDKVALRKESLPT